MDSSWTLSTLAAELHELVPLLGRTMFYHAKSSDQLTLMQGRVLYILSRHPLTVSSLAKKRGVSLQAASALVQSLVERGWVTRVPDPNDRRQSRLEVTPEGIARAQLAKDMMVSRLAESLVGLEPEALSAASVLLPALKRVLTEHLIADNVPDEPPDV